MKKSIGLLFGLILILVSCAKKKTCTCYDPKGDVVIQTKIKTASKDELHKFERDCEAKSTTSYSVTGSGFQKNTTTTITPCTIS
jgi:hypothetical protein